MLKKLAIVLIVFALAAPAWASVISKDGTTARDAPAIIGEPGVRDIDWVYNTGGSLDFVPDMGGSATGWAEWFVTTVYNDSGHDLYLIEFGFPCGGPATGPYGWLVWLLLPAIQPPPGPAETALFYGAFTPTSPDPNTIPPTIYSYVDVTDVSIVIPADTYFCFGYDNTGMGGMTSFNGVQTWGWYGGVWDPDSGWGRTAILQVKASFTNPIATEPITWGNVKALYH